MRFFALFNKTSSYKIHKKNTLMSQKIVSRGHRLGVDTNLHVIATFVIFSLQD